MGVSNFDDIEPHCLHCLRQGRRYTIRAGWLCANRPGAPREAHVRARKAVRPSRKSVRDGGEALIARAKALFLQCWALLRELTLANIPESAIMKTDSFSYVW